MSEDLIWAMVPIVTVISIAATVILRPLTRQLGQLIEIQGRKSGTRLPAAKAERLTEVLESLDTRLEALEQRMDVHEKLGDAVRDEVRRTLATPAEG